MITALALFGLLAGWVALPFVPALHEAYRRRDAAPLPISDRYGEDRRLGPSAGAPAVNGEAAALRDGKPNEAVALAGSWTGHDGLDVASLRVRGMALLGAESTVRERIVVEGPAVVGAGSTLAGSAEAGGVVWLGPGCRFERLHAPAIRTGAPDWLATRRPPARPPAVAAVLPEGTETLAGRSLVEGDLHLPAGARHVGDLVVHGSLTIGAGGVVDGSVKARGSVALGRGAAVTGSAVSEGDLTLFESASVAGAALADGRLHLAAGARVGRPAAPSTASGRWVVLEPDVTVHGTLWARAVGVTQDAAPRARRTGFAAWGHDEARRQANGPGVDRERAA